jgi:thiamine-monophosphate kinase
MFTVDPLEWILAGGEDHALAATFPASVTLPEPWRPVGRVEAGEGVTVDGRPWRAGPGWDHFS